MFERRLPDFGALEIVGEEPQIVYVYVDSLPVSDRRF